MKLFINFIILSSFFTLQAQDYYFINAKSGLNLRSDSDLTSNKTAKIPYGFVVEKIFDTNKKLSINDNGKEITGSWIKVRYDNYFYLLSDEDQKGTREGYIFDGFATKLGSEINVINTEIDNSEYQKLKKIASTEIRKPRKISSLDSVKQALKNRVEWLAIDEKEDFPREDLIKSILTENGQKLFINHNSFDGGFAEGWSGYYPDYKILVLEGGHNSDVSFSIETGETTQTIGNPQYIIASPKNTIRLNGSFGGQECVTYFFQKKIDGEFKYLTQLDSKFDICTFKTFYWLTETEFIYSKMNYSVNSENGVEDYFKAEIITFD